MVRAYQVAAELPAAARRSYSRRATAQALRRPGFLTDSSGLGGFARLLALGDVGFELAQVLLGQIRSEAPGCQLFDADPVGPGAVVVALDRAERATLQVSIGKLRLQGDRARDVVDGE